MNPRDPTGCLIEIQVIALGLDLLNEKLQGFGLEAKWIWDNALLYQLIGCDLEQDTSSLWVWFIKQMV